MRKNNIHHYAIVDIETTGGRPDRDRITEIGIVLHNGHEITDSYTTLINPGVTIPPMITRLTGIHQGMIENAPHFHEVAKDIIIRLESAVFIAHNARFDYHFIKEAFKDLGYTFNRPFLCTVKLSREYFPGLNSYSLENLIRHFNIPVNQRHRALEDALATTVIWEKILSVQNQEGFQLTRKSSFSNRTIPHLLPPEVLDKVPNECGVYYYLNQKQEIIYIGRSVHIRQRLDEHLTDLTAKAARLDEKIANIDWVLTGSELYAAILESFEIKKHQPIINKAQRTKEYTYEIYTEISLSGYKILSIRKTGREETAALKYPTMKAAKNALLKATKTFRLCRHFTLESGTGSACFEYHLAECDGACIGLENKDTYNERVKLALASLGNEILGSFYLIDKGTERNKETVFKIEYGQFTGMGYVDMDTLTNEFHLEDAITKMPTNPEIQSIVRQFMAKYRYKRIAISENLD